MVTRRTAKSKGNQFEYDVQASLLPKLEDLYRTSERGFQLQYDLCSYKYSVAIECKRIAGFTWNQLVKYYKKLKEKSGKQQNYLVFKANQQPCLVMWEDVDYALTVSEFENFFDLPFIKHKSTRAKK